MKGIGWLLVLTLAVFAPAACDDGNTGGGGTGEEAAIQEELYGWTTPLECLTIYYGIIDGQVHLRLFINGHDVGLVILTRNRPMQEISKTHLLNWAAGDVWYYPKSGGAPGRIEVQDFTTFCKGRETYHYETTILSW